MDKVLTVSVAAYNVQEYLKKNFGFIADSESKQVK